MEVSIVAIQKYGIIQTELMLLLHYFYIHLFAILFVVLFKPIIILITICCILDNKTEPKKKKVKRINFSLAWYELHSSDVCMYTWTALFRLASTFDSFLVREIDANGPELYIRK